ncbi:hypothetical protein BHM03_00034222 [Ensete ventricosum]|nr:hypothetical protein BHM03_00034222 [Ensete ventricosum]
MPREIRRELEYLFAAWVKAGRPRGGAAQAQAEGPSTRVEAAAGRGEGKSRGGGGRPAKGREEGGHLEEVGGFGIGILCGGLVLMAEEVDEVDKKDDVGRLDWATGRTTASCSSTCKIRLGT